MRKDAPRYKPEDRCPDCGAQLILVGKVHNCRPLKVGQTVTGNTGVGPAKVKAVAKTKRKAKGKSK